MLHQNKRADKFFLQGIRKIVLRLIFDQTFNNNKGRSVWTGDLSGANSHRWKGGGLITPAE